MAAEQRVGGVIAQKRAVAPDGDLTDYVLIEHAKIIIIVLITYICQKSCFTSTFFKTRIVLFL